MAIDFNDPEVKAAIESKATEIAASTVADNYVPASDIDGLKNKNSELLDKMAKLKDQYKGIDQGQLEEIRRVSAARENDEIIDMLMSGKTEEAKARLTDNAVTPWKNKVDEVATQFSVAQEELGNYKSKLEESQGKITEMQKRQYLRELTSSDDSFKGDYFDDFYQLNKGKMQIDEESGNVYAVKNGKPVLDTDGNKVSYADHYKNQKVTNGLFWNGGKGSGAKGIDGGEAMTGDPKSWSTDQKAEYIKAHGFKAMADLMQGSK